MSACSMYVNLTPMVQAHPEDIVQTEAERRRREARVQQAIENGLMPCLAYGYICLHVFPGYLPI